MSFFQKRLNQGERSFGQELVALREQRGFTRQELARHTGIHPLLIATFEDERVEQLTDPAYDERHVRLIVQALEGRVDFFLNKYRELIASRGVTKVQGMALASRLRRRDFFVTSRAVVFVGFLLVVAAVGGYVFREAWMVSSAPDLDVSTPTDGQRLSQAFLDVNGQTDPTAIVTVNGTQAMVDAAGQFSLHMDVPRGLTTLRIESRRRHGLPTVIERHVMVERIAATAN